MKRLISSIVSLILIVAFVVAGVITADTDPKWNPKNWYWRWDIKNADLSTIKDNVDTLKDGIDIFREEENCVEIETSVVYYNNPDNEKTKYENDKLPPYRYIYCFIVMKFNNTSKDEQPIGMEIKVSNAKVETWYEKAEGLDFVVPPQREPPVTGADGVSITKYVNINFSIGKGECEKAIVLKMYGRSDPEGINGITGSVGTVYSGKIKKGDISTNFFKFSAHKPDKISDFRIDDNGNGKLAFTWSEDPNKPYSSYSLNFFSSDITETGSEVAAYDKMKVDNNLTLEAFLNENKAEMIENSIKSEANQNYKASITGLISESGINGGESDEVYFSLQNMGAYIDWKNERLYWKNVGTEQILNIVLNHGETTQTIPTTDVKIQGNEKYVDISQQIKESGIYTINIISFCKNDGAQASGHIIGLGRCSINKLDLTIKDKIISWNKVEGASGYKITAPSMQDKLLGENDLSYSPTEANVYTVHAVGNEQMIKAYATVKIEALSKFLIQIDGLNIKWNKVEGAEKYKIIAENSIGNIKEYELNSTDSAYVTWSWSVLSTGTWKVNVYALTSKDDVLNSSSSNSVTDIVVR